MLLASSLGLLFFVVGLIWLLVGHEDAPPPAGLFFGFAVLYGSAMLGLSYWLLTLAADPSVSQRGAELQAYGIRTSPDAVLQLDEALRVVAMNPAAERRFGYSGHSVQGMPLRFLVSHLTPQAKRSDIVLPESRTAGVTAATSESRLEEARAVALRAGTRLTALAQPLYGYTELALEALPADHPVRADIAEIGRSSSRIALLAQTLELYGGSDRVQKSPVDLNSVMDDLKTDFDLLLDPGTQIKIEKSAQPAIVDADARLLRVAALLLVANSEESMAPNSRITIQVNEDSLRISDEGPGLTDTMRMALFTPFATAKDGERGVGLGLVAARAAMRLQNAELLVVRSNESGTVVSLLFPRDRMADEIREIGTPAVSAAVTEPENPFAAADEEGRAPAAGDADREKPLIG